MMLSIDSIPVYLYAVLLSLPLAFIYYRHYHHQSGPQPENTKPAENDKPLKTIMQAPRDDLAPPKDDPFTLQQLKQYDGSDTAKPIYVAIKGMVYPIAIPCSSIRPHATYLFISCLAGTVFDVSHKQDVYGPGKSYSVFAGKDGSKGLGMSSLKPENAIPDYSDLSEGDMKVLNDWHSFFSYVSLCS